MINILHAPLFTAVERDGGTKQLGLLDLLAEAHLFVDLKAASCTGKFALIRLCIAFLSDAYCLKEIDERRDLLEAGCFDRSVLERYVAACETNGTCFALDDRERPFMQAAYDANLDADAVKPVANILFDAPSGNNHIHLDHRHEDEHEIDAACAFESLLEIYMFCTSMSQGYPSGVNNAPPLYALLHGQNFFETLVLNMLSEEEMDTDNIPYGWNETAWCLHETIIPRKSEINMSLLKALTWQPRRLTIIWDEDAKVRSIFFQQGLDFRGNELWKDPHTIYIKTNKDTWTTKQPNLGRELWRDSGLLLCNNASIRSTIPIINASDVWDNRPAYLDIELIGMATDQGTILGRVNERLKMPRELFENESTAFEFRWILEKVELMYRALTKDVVWQFCHASDKKKKSSVAEQAGEIYLHAIRETVFGSYIKELLTDTSPSDRHAHFMDNVWKALDEALSDAVETTGDDVPTMKRQNAVRAKVRKDYMALRKELLSNE